MMNRREWWATVLAAAVAGSGGIRRTCSAGEPHVHYFHRQKSLSRCAIPCYAYGKDNEAARGIALASADAPRETKFFVNVAPRTVSRVGYRNSPLEPLPPPLTMIPDDQATALTSRRKPFHVHARSVIAAAASLDQIGLSLYDTGRLDSSGRLAHAGGPDGSLLGNNVLIRLRAYAAPTVPTPEVLPLDSPLVWQSEYKLWVARNQPVVVPLTKFRQHDEQELRRYFDEITHFEVELVTLQDR